LEHPDRPRRAGVGRHTLAVHAGREAPERVFPLVPPLYQSTVFVFDDLDEVDAVFDGRMAGYSYSRLGNPNADQLARAVAELEGLPAGVSTSSGMAAIHAALWACLTPERRRIVTAEGIYGGTYYLFEEVLRPSGIDVAYVPVDDLERLRRAVDRETAVLYAESMSNPNLRVADLPALGEIASRAGARFVVDNTFATPCLVRPAEHGAEIVVHSATKFLDGHHNALAGVAVGSKDLVDRMRRFNGVTGGTIDPFCAWLVLRGLRTLAVRVERQSATALALAGKLIAHPAVKAVHYPGLAGHPDHAVALRLFLGGFGSILSFDLGAMPPAERFMQALRIIRFAPSLGGFDTTIMHPGLTSHRSVPRAAREAAGIGDGLIRMSVGCEDQTDLWDDITQGLEAK
jgi:cystathionine beta-lyase/cystathionine gamma-synthase